MVRRNVDHRRCSRSGCDRMATVLLTIHGIVEAPSCDGHTDPIRSHFIAAGFKVTTVVIGPD